MDSLILELLYALPLLAWVLFVSLPFTRLLYEIMVERDLPDKVAVYFNRKIIHMLAGGFVALLVPRLFSTPLIPLSMGLILSLMLYIPHRKGRLLYWF
jgi:hypothetical protein